MFLVILPCSKRFLSGTSVFPSSQKPTLPKSNSIWSARTLSNESSELLNVLWQKKRITFTLFFIFYNYIFLNVKPANKPTHSVFLDTGFCSHSNCFREPSSVWIVNFSHLEATRVKKATHPSSLSVWAAYRFL